MTVSRAVRGTGRAQLMPTPTMDTHLCWPTCHSTISRQTQSERNEKSTIIYAKMLYCITRFPFCDVGHLSIAERFSHIFKIKSFGYLFEIFHLIKWCLPIRLMSTSSWIYGIIYRYVFKWVLLATRRPHIHITVEHITSCRGYRKILET